MILPLRLSWCNQKFQVLSPSVYLISCAYLYPLDYVQQMKGDGLQYHPSDKFLDVALRQWFWSSPLLFKLYLHFYLWFLSVAGVSPFISNARKKIQCDYVPFLWLHQFLNIFKNFDVEGFAICTCSSVFRNRVTDFCPEVFFFPSLFFII